MVVDIKLGNDNNGELYCIGEGLRIVGIWERNFNVYFSWGIDVEGLRMIFFVDYWRWRDICEINKMLSWRWKYEGWGRIFVVGIL